MPCRNTLLTAALAVSLIVALADSSLARSKRRDSSADITLPHDAYGTPIIMKGLPTERARPERDDDAARARRAAKDVRIPRGSSTYIPPPVPSPSASRAVTTGTVVQPYNPPPITTFGDRVNDAIHSYPLNKGLGNNPTDMQMYIRQNSNAP